MWFPDEFYRVVAVGALSGENGATGIPSHFPDRFIGEMDHFPGGDQECDIHIKPYGNFMRQYAFTNTID